MSGRVAPIATYPQHVSTWVSTPNQKSPAIAMITGLSFCSLRSEAEGFWSLSVLTKKRFD